MPIWRGGAVSILTRAFARVQRKAEEVISASTPSFNPHSSFRPSATQPHGVIGVGFVSILTRAFARVQPTAMVFIVQHAKVSILTRAFARVQRRASGRTRHTLPVSILTRAFARVQLVVAPAQISPGTRFNPHSSFRPSATRRGRASNSAPQRFQSSLELSPECNVKLLPVYVNFNCFNPHSSFRPSATEFNPHHVQIQFVSILTRAFARVQPEVAVRLQGGERVSILTRAFARVQPTPHRTAHGVYPWFQSSLELSPECNMRMLVLP